MMKTGRYNRNRVAILRNSDGYSPTNTRPAYTEGRSIEQNLRITGKQVSKAARAGDNTLTGRCTK